MRWASVGVIAAVALWILAGCSADSGVREGWLEDPFGASSPGPSGPGSNPGNASAEEQEVFNLTNQERQNAGVSELSWCDALAALARAHSHDMCKRDFFDHVNPEGEDPSARGRAGHAGEFTFDPCVPSPYSGVAENIAYGYQSAQQVMQGWMNSPGHRANILNSNYTHIGVGNCGAEMQGHTGCGTHWTQNFGIRR